MKSKLYNQANWEIAKQYSAVKDTNSPHFWWLISILGVAIIALLAYALTNKISCAEKIMEYISYASILLSITLSIFAILYTYTSNVQIQQQFEKINSAASNIISASDKLSTTSSKLDGNLDSLLLNLEKIDRTQEKMKASIDDLNTPTNSTTNITNIPLKEQETAY